MFGQISGSYERRSILIKANKPFSGWGNVSPDPRMTEDAIGGLVRRPTIFELQQVDSYSSKEALLQQRLQLEIDKQNSKRQSSNDSDNHPEEPTKCPLNNDIHHP